VDKCFFKEQGYERTIYQGNINAMLLRKEKFLQENKAHEHHIFLNQGLH